MPSPIRTQRGTISRRLADHLETSPFRWITPAQIAEETGIAEASVISAQLAHWSRQYPDHLERRRGLSRSFMYRYIPAQGRTAPTVSPEERTYGIEIECMVAYSPNESLSMVQERVAAAISEAGVPCSSEGYNHITRRHWKVIYDSSIRCQGYYGIEVVSPVLRGTAGEIAIAAVCRVLSEVGARINRTCGLHVHHGVSDIGENHLLPIYTAYHAAENHFDRIMPPSRREGSNVYCQPCRPRSFGRSRYTKVNVLSYSRYRTLEFRHHSGTIEADKIIHWIRLTRAFLSAPGGGAQSFVRFLQSLSLPQDTVQFYIERYNHFARRENRALLPTNHNQ